MIGTWGFLEQFSFVLIPALLLVVVMSIWRFPKKTVRLSLKGAVALLIAVLLPTFTTWKFIKEVQYHVFFSSLKPEKVATVYIGNLEVADNREKTRLLQAMQELQWFSSHHGGWAQSVPCRIKLTSGEERSFGIAMYLREPGAIIEFGLPDGRARIHAGYAFSKTLPSLLKEMGFSLKSE